MKIDSGIIVIIAGLLMSAAAQAGEYDAPLDIRKGADVKFAAAPKIEAAGENVKVSFAVAAPTDVEVAILDGQGRVVRHLAAGLLGKSAPEPFKKDSLEQEVIWDRKDDAGKPAAGGPWKVRVRLGLQPRLDKILGRDDNILNGRVCAITESPKGELFVLLTDLFHGRTEMRVLDRDGRYLRTIMPYGSDTPEAQSKEVGHVMIDGNRQPLVFNGQSHTFYPLVAGLRQQTMAWHPDGYLIAASATGTMSDQGPPRYLIAFHPTGGAPEKVGFVGPRIRRAPGFQGGDGEAWATGRDRLAVSADGQWIYVVQNMWGPVYDSRKERTHCVFRVKWTDKDLGQPWLGKKEPGAGDDDFNNPQGMAVDKAGRVYICDLDNGRVKLYSPDGKLLGKLAVQQPEQIAVHPASGEIYLLCRNGKLMKFAAWKDEAPKELASLLFDMKTRGPEFIALDSSAARPRVWVSLRTENAGSLVAVDDDGAALKEGTTLKTGDVAGALKYPSFMAADPARGRVIVYEHLSKSMDGYRVIDIASGKMEIPKIRGSDLAVDQDGNIYVIDPYGSDSMSRFTPDFKPLPFSATGKNKIPIRLRPYGPDMGLRGHCIAPNGDLYVRRSPNHGCVSTVDVWTTDGKQKKAGLVNGAGSGDSGLGVDNRGNIYLGTNLKTKDRYMPADFAKAVPISVWKYYYKDNKEAVGSWKPDGSDSRPAPWSYVYANPYFFHMGYVFKFGPEGGTIYGNFGEWAENNPGMSGDKAPPGATPYESGYLWWHKVRAVGVKWRYQGVGIIPTSFDAFRGDDGCVCLQTQLDADPYGRVYAPSVFYSSVEMMDSAGNRIARIGAYGNADSAGPKSRVPGPEIAFAWPTDCDYAEFDGKLYVTDSVNRRVMVVRFDAAATELVDLK